MKILGPCPASIPRFECRFPRLINVLIEQFYRRSATSPKFLSLSLPLSCSCRNMRVLFVRDEWNVILNEMWIGFFIFIENAQGRWYVYNNAETRLIENWTRWLIGQISFYRLTLEFDHSCRSAVILDCKSVCMYLWNIKWNRINSLLFWFSFFFVNN